MLYEIRLTKLIFYKDDGKVNHKAVLEIKNEGVKVTNANPITIKGRKTFDFFKPSSKARIRES